MTQAVHLTARNHAAAARAAAMPFAGIFTDLVTPFRDGRLDEAAFSALIESQIAAGVQGVVVASGVAGERPTLSQAEATRLLTLAVARAKRRIKVVADAASNATAVSVERVREAADLGVDAVLISAPWYNRPSQQGVVRHFQALAGASALPILLWDHPARSALALSLETLHRIGELPQVVGMIDATGDMARVSPVRRICPHWKLLSGDDPSALGYLAQGGVGRLSLAANIIPEVVRAIHDACARQDWNAARRSHEGLADLEVVLNLDPVPSAVKLALAEQGVCRPDVRLPITPCGPAVRARLERALRTSPPWL